MIFSKNLYIVDDLKWCFINAILSKDIKRAIFWINEYYTSGYKKESWQLIWITYSSYYFTENSYYNKTIMKLYKKWLIKEDFNYILEIVYKFYKITKKNVDFFKIIIGNLKYKSIDVNIPKDVLKRVHLPEKNLFNNLVCSLIKKDYKGIWFFLQFNFELSLKIIRNYYHKTQISLEDVRIFDRKMQVLMFIWCINEKKKKKKFWKIKIEKGLLDFYNGLISKKHIVPYKLLKNERLYEVSDEIGCFNLERFNYDVDEIKNMYFYNWLYYVKECPYWKNILEQWCVEFDENKEPIFMNDDLEEKFYSNYGLEPDEQSLETHNKSIKEIKKYNMVQWIRKIV